MKNIFAIIIFCLIPKIIFTQTKPNSKEFFPYIDSTVKGLYQTVEIIMDDTIEYAYHKYEYEIIGENKYLLNLA